MASKVDVVRTTNSWKTVINEKQDTVLLQTKNGYRCYKQPTKKETR